MLNLLNNKHNFHNFNNKFKESQISQIYPHNYQTIHSDRCQPILSHKMLLLIRWWINNKFLINFNNHHSYNNNNINYLNNNTSNINNINNNSQCPYLDLTINNSLILLILVNPKILITMMMMRFTLWIKKLMMPNKPYMILSET